MHFSASIIRSSNNSPVILACVLGLGVGIYLFYRGFQLLQRRRLILDTPFSKIRSAPLGMIEVSGLAVGPYTMAAPITAKACYYYRTAIWELRQQGKNSQWVKAASECMHLPFFLDDNTGRVLVDPRQAELDLHCDFQQEFCDSSFSLLEPAPPNVRSFLARHGIGTRNKIKVEEYCIKPRNTLFILGTLAENKDVEVVAKPVPDSDNRHAVSPLARFSLNTSGSVVPAIFDGGDEESRFAARMATTATMDGSAQEVIRLSTPSAAAPSAEMSQQQKIAAAMMKAGIMNPAAWAAAGLSTTPVAAREGPVSAYVASGDDPNAFDHHPPVVLTKGTNNNAFMISWRSQRDVVRSLGWKCAMMIWGGPALSLISVYFLLGILQLR